MADQSVNEEHKDGVKTCKSPAHSSGSPTLSIDHSRNLSASYHAGDSSSKKSTQKSTDKEKRVPHYLRASTGSCHDFCKHGKSHSFKEKPRKYLQKKIATPFSSQFPVLIMVSGERKKEKALNPSPEIISHSPKPQTTLNTNKVVKRVPLMDIQKINSLPEKKNYSRKSDSTSSKKKPALLKSKPLSGKKHPSPEIVESVRFLFKKDEELVDRASSAGNKMLRAEKKATLTSKKSSSLSVKPKPVKPKPLSSSSLDNLDSTRGKGRKNNVSIMKIPKASTKKESAPKVPNPITRTAHNDLRKSGNVKSLSYSKGTNITTRRVDKTKTPEKILHHKEENRENGNAEPNNIVIPEKKETPKKTKVVTPEDKRIRTPVKLKFRNAKLLDLQSNSNSPKILRFRRARAIMPNDGRSDLRRRIFKKGSVNDYKTGEGTSSTEKIVLKHQEVPQGKKDGQGLLNNVIIEQTASKLVESKKSKVKALVGAFETVISLQESRPSSQAVG